MKKKENEDAAVRPSGIKNNYRKALELFLYFFRIGWYTFGGGWSIIAQIQRDYCEKKKEIAPEELLDLATVGKSLPGVMVGNVTLMFGYRMGGPVGAAAALLGLSVPPVVILTIVTYLYSSFRDNIYVAKALTGIRACVVPIILSATVKMIKPAFRKWYGYPIFGAATLLLIFTKVNAIFIVIAAGALGLLLSALNGKRKEAGE